MHGSATACSRLNTIIHDNFAIKHMALSPLYGQLEEMQKIGMISTREEVEEALEMMILFSLKLQ